MITSALVLLTFLNPATNQQGSGLLSQSAAGIQTQLYCALIACLLLQLAGGSVKPNQWTYKLLCLYAQGWATEDEVLEHLRERAGAEAKKSS